MMGRIFDAGYTSAPDHAPKRAQNFACVQRGAHNVRADRCAADWELRIVSTIDGEHYGAGVARRAKRLCADEAKGPNFL